jgi:hypothetical protein
VLWFVATRSDFEAAIPAMTDACEGGTGLWVCWPKKSSPLHVDLTQMDIRNALLASSSLVDLKICRVDGDWSGCRFAVRKNSKSR